MREECSGSSYDRGEENVMKKWNQWEQREREEGRGKKVSLDEAIGSKEKKEEEEGGSEGEGVWTW